VTVPSPEDWQQRQDALDDDEVARHLAPGTDWPALLARLRDDPAFGLKLVAADSVAALSQWFTAARGGWREEADRWGLLGDNAYGAAWVYEGDHDIPFAFNGVPASGRPVTVRGFTLIGPDPSRTDAGVRFRRYVDWAGVFGQLGLTLNWRIPLPKMPPPDDGDGDAASA
jgi:hypothetical protein